MKTLIAVVLVFCLPTGAQEHSTSRAKKVPCYSGEVGTPSCTPQQRAAKAKVLATARTAAVLIDANQSIACGDGSDGCFRKDQGAITIIEKEIGDSELWQTMTKVDAKRADILLRFATSIDRESLSLYVFDAASNDILWSDRRSIVALDNDVAREIAHFLQAKQGSVKNSD